MDTLEQTIRERAYHLWEADGRRTGEADSYWIAAEREVLSAAMFAAPQVAVKKQRAPAKPRAKRKAA